MRIRSSSARALVSTGPRRLRSFSCWRWNRSSSECSRSALSVVTIESSCRLADLLCDPVRRLVVDDREDVPTVSKHGDAGPRPLLREGHPERLLGAPGVAKPDLLRLLGGDPGRHHDA